MRPPVYACVSVRTVEFWDAGEGLEIRLFIEVKERGECRREK